jgi:alanine transaminase
MKLHAKADDGYYYPAEVLSVSKKKVSKIAVKVHYSGYDKMYDEWKPIEDLRSKKIPKSVQSNASDLMPEDVKRRAQEYLAATGGSGVGAYTGSTGLKVVRDQVAAFIERRDGFPADPEAIELHTGASEGVKRVIQALVSNEREVIMIPKPQYPLYSAALTMFGGTPQYYDCEEELDWGVKPAELERSFSEGSDNGKKVKGIAVINPGNPSGSVLSLEDVKMFITFARDKGIPILADEVYQVNVYAEKQQFHSFKKVLRMLQVEDKSYDSVQLMSFHSTSKGIIGECGLRGGYTEFVGMSDSVMSLFVKVASTSLSSNTMGQIMVGLMVTPPKKGDASYASFQKETKGIFDGMKERAKLLTDGLNAIDGISTRQIQGAMYAFAKVDIPEKAVLHAASKGQEGDEFWCLELVNKTGIVCVPGTGFGQKKGTFHFRITILPPTPMLKDMLKRLSEFQQSFTKEWSGKS